MFKILAYLSFIDFLHIKLLHLWEIACFLIPKAKLGGFSFDYFLIKLILFHYLTHLINYPVRKKSMKIKINDIKIKS